jgi:hypothetical protein
VYFTDAPSWLTGSPDTGQSFVESTVPCEFPVCVPQSDFCVVVEHSDLVFSSQQLFSCAFTNAVAANNIATIANKIFIFIFVFPF